MARAKDSKTHASTLLTIVTKSPVGREVDDELRYGEDRGCKLGRSKNSNIP